MSRARPILVLSQLPPPIHGSTVMTQLFVDTLNAMGERWEVVDKGFSSNLAEIGQLTVRKLLRSASLPFVLGRRLVAGRPEFSMVFLTCSRGSFLADSALLYVLRLFRVPYAVYLHGRGFKELQASGPVYSRLVRSAFASATAAVILTPRLADDIDGLIDVRRVLVVPNAIEVAPAPNRSYSQTPVTMLYLSNYDPTKGALEFLRAAAVVAKQTSQARFVLAGGIRGEGFFAQLRQFIESERLTDIVELHGGVYGAQKSALLERADIFVFPTRYPLETFGLVNLEAMRAGLPVIAAPIAGIPDVVIDGETGFTVDPGNTAALAGRILELIERPELRERFGKAGRARFEQQFTPQRFRENWTRALSGIRALF